MFAEQHRRRQLLKWERRLTLIGIVLVLFAIPTPLQAKQHRDAGVMQGYLMTALKNQALVRMNIGVLVLHLVMTRL